MLWHSQRDDYVRVRGARTDACVAKRPYVTVMYSLCILHAGSVPAGVRGRCASALGR